jgi:hypothetical protein
MASVASENIQLSCAKWVDTAVHAFAGLREALAEMMESYQPPKVEISIPKVLDAALEVATDNTHPYFKILAAEPAGGPGGEGPAAAGAAPGRPPTATEPGAKLAWAPAPAGRSYAFSCGWTARQNGLPSCLAETLFPERHWPDWLKGWDARGELEAREAVRYEAPGRGRAEPAAERDAPRYAGKWPPPNGR